MWSRSAVPATALLALLCCGTAAAQTTGQIVGQVVALPDSAPVGQITVLVVQPGDTVARVHTNRSGEFVTIGLRPGEYTVLARGIGYRPAEMLGVSVRSGISTRILIVLEPAAVEMPSIPVVAEAHPLLEPDVSSTRQVVTGNDLATAPIQDIAEALELRTGVSEGHFRGGRVGQETYVIDGVDVRNQLSASRPGIGFSLSPTAVQELNVFTSGFSADQPSAVSGVVTFVTRSGPSDRWFGRLEGVTDEWAPSSIDRGYARAGASAGGPIGPATGFFDLLLIGRADADPRVKGLTCLDVTFPCPATRPMIPHHEGDRYYAFSRFDLPISGSVRTSLTFNRNRDQHELYSTRFKYALRDYLAEREIATLGTLQLDGLFASGGAHASRVTARLSLGQLDHYLGVPDTAQPGRIGQFMLGNLRFRGEDAVRRSAAEQVAAGTRVPGYAAPSDSGLGSPYGIFGSDLFVTDGTSGVAEWSRMEFADARVDVQAVVSPRLDLKVGGDLKLYRIQFYQDAHADLAGAAPNFVKFYPRTFATWIHSTLYALEAATIDLGIRLEGYQPQLAAPTDRTNLKAPVLATQWRILAHPRVGFAMPLSVLGIDRAAFRWNFGRFSQPPDFQFFFDQTLDDSLNTAVRRQGNPYLGYEKATAYEFGLDYIVANDVVLKTSAYLKDLNGLTTSGIAVGSLGTIFTNLDYGKVEGIEVRLEARLDDERRVELGYSLQRAYGVVSTAFDSVVTSNPTAGTLEIPLQFDRRHAIDLNIRWPLAWGVVVGVGGTAGSGYPVPGAATERLPWSVNLAAKVTKDVQIGGALLRVVAEGRNLLHQANLVTARPGGGVTPDIAAIEMRAADETAGAQPIPRESPLYLPAFDTDQNGFLDRSEQTAARRAALLDYAEPTLFYGEAFQLRIGAEIFF
jgi:hypothetical protein